MLYLLKWKYKYIKTDFYFCIVFYKKLKTFCYLNVLS